MYAYIYLHVYVHTKKIEKISSIYTYMQTYVYGKISYMK